MGPEMWTAISGVAVSGLTAVGTVAVARAGRRTAKQERRDDFGMIKEALNDQITGLKSDLADQKAEARRQGQRSAEQDLAIGYLLGHLRSLHSYIRRSGLEPPSPPTVPDQLRAYIGPLDL